MHCNNAAWHLASGARSGDRRAAARRLMKRCCRIAWFDCSIMPDPLRSFCIACARFKAGDQVGELMAVAAASPYFVVYHVAVLLHARR